MPMRCVDSRRLTGPNLIWDRAGAVLDVVFEHAQDESGIELWRTEVRRMLNALGWNNEQTCVRSFKDGASLAISAPIDALYAATDVNDWAFEAAIGASHGQPQQDFEAQAARLRETIADESNPPLTALREAACEHQTPILIDTEYVSLGMGRYSETWSLDRVPAVTEISWPELQRIPVGLITGTNGKTTSVRLCAQIAQAGGYTPGLSCTDWIAAGDTILDSGDYSGPGGARTVLRNKGVDLAILETARGGLLRRGLAVDRVDAVLITNVAADHLGEFGVHNVDELADVKWVVTRALADDSTLVLNADDPRLLERAQASAFNILWFSPDPNQPTLKRHIDNGGYACTVIDDQITLIHDQQAEPVVPVTAVPLTYGGAAEHNVYNALGVTGLAYGLGLSRDAIGRGLRAMGPNDNPGRSNYYNINQATVIVDFAHNPHGMAAFIKMAAALPGQHKSLLIGQAGDRSDDDIRGLATMACDINWDQVVIKEMDDYARGRRLGETADILFNEFIHRGISPQHMQRQRNELDAVRNLVETANAGDLLILLIHERRREVLDYLKQQAEAV